MNLMDKTYIDAEMSYLINQMGKPITINGTPATGLIGNIDSQEDIRKLITKSPITRGDFIVYKGNNYLAISEVDEEKYYIYNKVIIQKCPHVVKFNFSGTIKECPSIIETKVLDIETGQYVSIPVGKMLITIKDNINVALQQRLIKFNEAWIVDGIDKTKQGLITLTVSKTTTNANDDLENEIADRWQYETKHLYTIETTNTDETIEQDKTLQFVVTVKDNGAVVENPTITYSSDNSNCSVDEKGLITGVDVGTSIITATFSADEITKSISINITVTEPVPQDNFTYTLVGDISNDTEISSGSYIIYTAKKYNNDVEVTDAQFDFEVIAGDTPSDAYKLTVLNDKECKIECLQYTYYITLMAKDRADNANYIEKQIRLKSIF